MIIESKPELITIREYSAVCPFCGCECYVTIDQYGNEDSDGTCDHMILFNVGKAGKGLFTFEEEEE